ncbi:MAG: DEAD/DEAH box helicase [Spirochaetaceae bacterium]|jgi:ATP-dependent RNA helicase RhlB|nr:DEAD/DEAH box helicase [Spirochaetaceae bacterium]
MKFQLFNLPDDLKRALADAGYVDAMPVQEKVIELGLDGRDLYVQSQTGTGKTAAFLIVIFQRLFNDPALKGRKALIMVPTRELAVQVEEEAKLLGKYLPYKIGSFYGGVGYGGQQSLLRKDVDILVGTPGRVLDLNAGGEMNLADIAFLVLDEADRMFDMGFYPDLRKLIKVVPPPERRQTMLFSATLNVYVKNLALEYTKEPVEIEIEPEHITVEEIEQLLYHVPSEKKFSLLLGILRNKQPESAIIFCNTKRYVEVVARRLHSNGINCEFISGDLPQKKRLSLIDDFKAGKFRYLAATDVAARGIDIEGLALVVNYDLPVEAENYVHRIGRTARAGKNGKAISFASEQDVYELTDIERYIGIKIPSEIAGEPLYAEEEKRRRFDERTRDDSGKEYRHGDKRKRGGRKHEGSEKRQDAVQRENENSNSRQAAKPKLLELSLEERKAYYEKKYGGKNANKQTAGQKPANSESGVNTEKPRRSRNKRRSNKKNDIKQFPPKKEQAVSARPNSPAKTGLFTKIVSIFKKKPGAS